MNKQKREEFQSKLDLVNSERERVCQEYEEAVRLAERKRKDALSALQSEEMDLADEYLG